MAAFRQFGLRIFPSRNHEFSKFDAQINVRNSISPTSWFCGTNMLHQNAFRNAQESEVVYQCAPWMTK